MRKTILLGAVLSSATVLTALVAGGNVNPLNLKPGLWQTTMTSIINGAPPMTPDMQAKLAQLSPEQRAQLEAMLKSQYGGTPQTRTWKSCVKKEDLNKWPFDDPRNKCKYTVQSSTGSTMDVSGTCTQNEGYKYDFKLHLVASDSEHAAGTGQMVISQGGQTMTGKYSGSSKWIGATCPADMN